MGYLGDAALLSKDEQGDLEGRLQVLREIGVAAERPPSEQAVRVLQDLQMLACQSELRIAIFIHRAPL